MSNLEEIVRKDASRGNHRNFDGEMPHWNKVANALKILPQRTLGKRMWMRNRVI